jgi:hypothetical protein
MLGTILCLFGIHSWDGHTDENYPPPQCTRCKAWHWRKRQTPGIRIMFDIFAFLTIINTILLILCIFFTDDCPLRFFGSVCIAFSISLWSMMYFSNKTVR